MMPEKCPYVSVKHLLKQVYATHVNTVKDLEEEVSDLKNKLLEANRKIEESEFECKRCVELEEAFKTYKSSQKQTKHLGQKLLDCDSSHNETLRVGSGKETKSTLNPKEKAATEKVVQKKNLLQTLMSSNSNEYQDSLNLSPVLASNFTQDYSTLNVDSMVLAPDTVGITCDFKPFGGKTKRDGKDAEQIYTKTVVVTTCGKSPGAVVCSPESIKGSAEIKNVAKKRSHSDSTDSEILILNKDDSHKRESIVKLASNNKTEECMQDPQNSTDSLTSKVKKFKSELNVASNKNANNAIRPLSVEICSDAGSASRDNVVQMKQSKKSYIKDVRVNEDITDPLVQVCNDAGIASRDNVAQMKQSKKSYIKDARANEDITDPLVQVCNDAGIASHDGVAQVKHSTNSHSKSAHTNKGVNDPLFQVSPSLLPSNKNADTALNKEDNEGEDDDFHPSTIIKNSLQEDGLWRVCNKKKFKKEQRLKSIKSTSKFKLQLDALPANFKKPNYRQTKLSKSIFLPKSLNSSDKADSVSLCNKKTKKRLSECNMNSPSSLEEHVAVLTSTENIKTSTIDFDATCIPDNYVYEIIPSGSVTRGRTSPKKSEKDFDDSIELIQAESPCNNLSASPSVFAKGKTSLKSKIKSAPNEENKAPFEDFISSNKGSISSEYLNSFDRLPKKEEPNYKYKEKAVHKQAERRQLNGFDCKECENYYSDLGLSDKEKKERMKKCSRHRAKFAPPPTPEHFWELEFPDTQECKARGYMNETQKVTLKSHRRRPLEL